jgi:hypothetical protein
MSLQKCLQLRATYVHLVTDRQHFAASSCRPNLVRVCKAFRQAISQESELWLSFQYTSPAPPTPPEYPRFQQARYQAEVSAILRRRNQQLAWLQSMAAVVGEARLSSLAEFPQLAPFLQALRPAPLQRLELALHGEADVMTALRYLSCFTRLSALCLYGPNLPAVAGACLHSLSTLHTLKVSCMSLPEPVLAAALLLSSLTSLLLRGKPAGNVAAALAGLTRLPQLARLDLHLDMQTPFVIAPPSSFPALREYCIGGGTAEGAGVQVGTLLLHFESENHMVAVAGGLLHSDSALARLRQWPSTEEGVALPGLVFDGCSLDLAPLLSIL